MSQAHVSRRVRSGMGKIPDEEEKQQAVKDTARQIVSLMIKKAYPTEEIISVVPNYSWNDVEALRNEMSKTDKTVFGE